MKNPCILISMLFVLSSINYLKAQYSVDAGSDYTTLLGGSAQLNTNVDDFPSETDEFNIKKRIQNNELSIIDFNDFRDDVPFEGEGSLTILSYPTHGSFTIDDNGTPLDPRDDIGTYSPDVDYVGMDAFTFEICDTNGGCVKINISLLIESDRPIIPNIFSPNGDGKNDYFIISNLSLFPQNTITIYNRWGTKMFEASPYKNDWNGKNLSGKNAPDGTYFYIFDPGNGSITARGTVTVLR